MNYIYDKETRCLVKNFSCGTMGLHVERTRDWDKAMELVSEVALEVEGFLCGVVDCERYRSVDSEAFRSAEAAFDVASARRIREGIDAGGGLDALVEEVIGRCRKSEGEL